MTFCGGLNLAVNSSILIHFSISIRTQSASYDFLEGKWKTGDLSVGGEKAKMNDSWLEGFNPKLGASAKIAGQGCVRF